MWGGGDVSESVPDRLYERLFTPRALPQEDWPLCREDWARVEFVSGLAWRGQILDVGSGDGTLGAMVAARNPLVRYVRGVETHLGSIKKAQHLWADQTMTASADWPDGPLFHGALCCEVLEHLSVADGDALLKRIKSQMLPGAMVLVTVPHEYGSRASYTGHVTRYDAVSLWCHMKEAGLPIKHSGEIASPVTGHAVWLYAIAYA